MSMYSQHRGMIAQPPAPSRLGDLLDAIRHEFESQARAAGDFQERDSILNSQVQELHLMREKLYGLEQQHLQMKNESDKRIEQLQRELELRGGPSAHIPPQHHSAQQQPPSIGHGPRDLFGGIMQGNGQGNLGLPPQDAGHGSGIGPHLGAGAGLSTAGAPPQQGASYGAPFAPPGPNGYAHGPPPAAQSPGSKAAAQRRPGPGAPGGQTPMQNPIAPYGDRASHVPTPPPGSRQPPPPQSQYSQLPDVGNELSKLEGENLPPSIKKTGNEWWAIFNPRIPRVLDINLVHTLEHASVVCCVRFSADGRYVATGCNRAAHLYDVNTGNLVCTLEDPEAGNKDGDLYIRSVCFSPDGRYLATGAEDKVIRVWDIEQRKVKCHFEGHDQDIYSLDFSRNGRTIASGSGDRTVRLWDIEENQAGLVVTIEEGVTTVALSHDGRYVAAGSLDKSVRVWETETGTPVERLDGPSGHGDSVYSVAFSPNSRELVSGSLDRTIKMWQLSSPGTVMKGRCIRTFEGHADFVLSVALTPDNEWVLSGSKDRGVQFWDPKTGATQLHLQGHKNSVISVAPSPRGHLFATGSGDNKARIWRYERI